MRLLSQPLDGRRGVFHREGVLWDVCRGPLPSLSQIEYGYQNETIFSHAGGEERRKQREQR